VCIGTSGLLPAGHSSPGSDSRHATESPQHGQTADEDLLRDVPCDAYRTQP